MHTHKPHLKRSQKQIIFGKEQNEWPFHRFRLYWWPVCVCVLLFAMRIAFHAYKLIQSVLIHLMWECVFRQRNIIECMKILLDSRTFDKHEWFSFYFDEWARVNWKIQGGICQVVFFFDVIWIDSVTPTVCNWKWTKQKEAKKYEEMYGNFRWLTDRMDGIFYIFFYSYD